MIFRVDLVCHPKRANTPAQKTAHNNVRVILTLLQRTQVSYFGNSIKQRLGLMVIYPSCTKYFFLWNPSDRISSLSSSSPLPSKCHFFGIKFM